ncbi:TPA: hypothetical protein VCM63_001950 [Campylobacter coli]|uniref:hypothetical protein n=1 Tax=Campylobacter coli TaxID=195 RepID=UPI000F95F2B8|nr:hypothetical protein [Campylobacter coli]ECP7410811.1 hypothetical protein [Campylobacter jejuni]HEE9555744.1 hypothetical protein [Campylobacter jejuni subsp. jejuni]EAJ8721424.1 hypothetical protein [Campylobacter coli]EAK4337893.1 hypothetical protein [Campylobacter coli]
MAKIDELKEELGILKFWLGITVATLLALIGWSATNYQKADWFLLVGAVICIFIAIGFLIVINKKIKAKIKEIGKA